MHLKIWSAAEIYHQLLGRVAPLPSQREYAHQLCEMIAIHLNRCTMISMGVSATDLPMQSGIIVAPTGSGKTYLLRRLCDAIGIGLITISADSLAKEGWKGSTLSQQILAAKETMPEEKFRNAIVFVDEIDKAVMDRGERGDPIPNLLQLYNGGEIALDKGSNNESETVSIDSWSVLLAGAFVGLDKQIEKRLYPAQGIGFGTVQSGVRRTREELFRQVTHQDLVSYGIMDELMGRVACILSIPTPTMEDYRQLLTMHKGNLTYQYRQYLLYVYGVDLQIRESAVKHIASHCMQFGTGARAVAPYIHQAMRTALLDVERDKTICRVVLDGADIQFERGTRNSAIVFFRERAHREKIKIISASSHQRLASILCSVYRRGGGDMRHADELHAFLSCTIFYLLFCLQGGICNFESLNKVSGTIKAAPKGRRSTFDILCLDEIQKNSANSEKLSILYGKFLLHSRKRTPVRIPAALKLIQNRMRKEYDITDVQLIVCGGEKDVS